jgi:hypothetical protein
MATLNFFRQHWSSPFQGLKNRHPDKIEIRVDGTKVVHTLFPTVLREHRHKGADCSVLVMKDKSLVILLRCLDGTWALDEFKAGLTLPEIKQALDAGVATSELCILDALFIDAMDLDAVRDYLSTYQA